MGTFEWMSALQRDDLVEIVALLEAVRREQTIRKDRIFISALSHEASKWMGIGDDDEYLRQRRDIAELLLKQEVLKRVILVGHDRLEIVADPAVVEAAISSAKALAGGGNDATGAVPVPPGGGKTAAPATGARINAPEKLSAQWLWLHMPLRWWGWLGAAALTMFSLGVTAGQTTFVRELFHLPEKTVAQQSQSGVAAEIAILERAHIARVDSLTHQYSALVNEANSPYRQGAMASQLARDVRTTLDSENASFAKQLEALHALQTGR